MAASGRAACAMAVAGLGYEQHGSGWGDDGFLMQFAQQTDAARERQEGMVVRS